MAANAATLALILEAKQFVAAAKEAEAALTGVAATAEKTQQTITGGEAREARRREEIRRAELLKQEASVVRQAEAALEAAQQMYKMDEAALRASLARKELSHKQALEAHLINIEAFNRAILAAQAKLGAAPQTAAVQAAFTNLGGSLILVEQNANKAVAGMGLLKRAMATQAAHALGISSIFTKMGSVMGTMALGSVQMVAIFAGLAVLGKAYEALTEKTKKAKEETRKFTEELTRARKEAAYGAMGKEQETLAKANAQVGQLERQLAAMRAYIRANQDRVGMSGMVEAVQKKEADLEKRLAEARLNATFAFKEYARVSRENFRATAEVIEDSIPKVEKFTVKIDELAVALARLPKAPALGAAALTGSSIPTMQTVGLTAAPFGLPTLNALDKIQAANAEAAKQSADMWEQSFEAAIEGIQQTFARGFDDILTNGLDGFDDFADNLIDLFRGVAAQIAAALTSRALGLDKALADVKKGSGVGAAATSGAYAVAGAAVLNLVSAIIDMGRAAKEAARQMRELESAVSKNIDDIFASLQPDSLEKRIYEALAPIRDAWKAVNAAANKHDPDWLVREMARLDLAAQQIIQKVTDDWNAGLEKIADTTADAIAAEAALAAEREAAAQATYKAVQQGREDWEVQLLRAQGRDKEADQMQRYLELNRLLAETTDERTRQLIIETYQARELAIALAEQDAAAKALAEQLEREADEAARAAEEQARLAAEEAKLAEQAAKAAAQLAQANATLQRNLDIRESELAGRTDEAAIMRKQLEQGEELRRYEAEGVSGSLLERLKRIQAAELEQLKAQLEAARAAKEAEAAQETGRTSAAVSEAAASEVVRSVKSVSETTAIRMADLQMTANIYLSYLPQIYRVLGGDGAALPRVGVGGQARGITVQVNNYAPINAGTPASIGAEIGKGVSRYLAKDQTATSRASGDATV